MTEESLSKKSQTCRDKSKDQDGGVSQFQIVAEERNNNQLRNETGQEKCGAEVTIDFCTDLVLEPVEHETNHFKAGIHNSGNTEDQNPQDDPNVVFIPSLLKNCLETTYGEVKEILKYS